MITTTLPSDSSSFQQAMNFPAHQPETLSMNQEQLNAAMLRAAQSQQQPSQGFGMSSSNQMAAMQQMLNQNQLNQQQGQQQQQQQPNTMGDQQVFGGLQQGNNMGVMGMNFQDQLKQMQQFQQQFGNSVGAPSNALLITGNSRPTDASVFLQSMLEQQKVASQTQLQPQQQQHNQQRFDNPLVSQGLASNPLLQPSFFQDARLLMAQNQLNAATLQGLQNEVPLPSPHSLFHRDGSRRMRGGVIEPFPEKLHRLLIEVEAAGRGDVVSFVAGGRAFAIHKPDKFFKEIVPLYFRQSRLSSFKRQLNLYGFELINSGPARGGYYHDLFIKDRPELCRRMRRVAVKVSSKDKDGKDSEDEKAQKKTKKEDIDKAGDDKDSQGGIN